MLTRLKRLAWLFTFPCLFPLGASHRACAQSGKQPVATTGTEPSLTQVNKELSNPISSTWSLTFQDRSVPPFLQERGRGG